MAAKKKVMLVPQPGEIVTMCDWLGTHIDVRVTEIMTSKKLGEVVAGYEMDGGHAARSVTLPLSHLVERAIVRNIGHGKWDIELPNGKVVRERSKAAAREYCDKRGLVFQEV